MVEGYAFGLVVGFGIKAAVECTTWQWEEAVDTTISACLILPLIGRILGWW